MPVLLDHAIEDSTDIFGISGGGGGLNPSNPPPRYATAYDKNSVLPTHVNTCDIMRCENCSQALQVIPLPKSANWIDIKLQQRTAPNSD